MLILTIYDSAANAYLRPFFARAPGEASRIFVDLVNDKDSPIGQHPGDYTLFVVGEFSELTGEVVACDPRSLGNGVNFTEGETFERMEVSSA